MKGKHHLAACLLGTILLSVSGSSLQAQNESSKKSILSVNVGPSWYVGRFMGITDHADSYRNDLRKGVSWQASCWYAGKGYGHKGLTIGPGFIYQGSSYRETRENGSDKIGMHYLAPQLGAFFFLNRYMVQLSTGVGYQFYSDKSTVYDKPRDVSMNKLACNLSLNGEYFLTEQWGISARLNWIFSKSERYSVEYHGQYWQVEHPQTGEGYFGQLSLLFGLNYHF
ncbi:hypothetical protein [Bacteroides rodentium]